jgi:malate synthase
MSNEYRCPEGVEINGQFTREFAEILTPEAIAFLTKLHRKFDATRKDLLARRVTRQKEIDA